MTIIRLSYLHVKLSRSGVIKTGLSWSDEWVAKFITTTELCYYIYTTKTHHRPQRSSMQSTLVTAQIEDAHAENLGVINKILIFFTWPGINKLPNLKLKKRLHWCWAFQFNIYVFICMLYDLVDVVIFECISCG